MGGLEWGEKDHLLTLAYTIYLDGLNEFGYPVHEARHFDNDGWYEAETVTDHAAAAFDQHSKDNPKPGPGERVVVKFTRPEDRRSALQCGDDPLRETDTGKHEADKDNPPSTGITST